jgi:hypothetical protein
MSPIGTLRTKSSNNFLFSGCGEFIWNYFGSIPVLAIAGISRRQMEDDCCHQQVGPLAENPRMIFLGVENILKRYEPNEFGCGMILLFKFPPLCVWCYYSRIGFPKCVTCSTGNTLKSWGLLCERNTWLGWCQDAADFGEDTRLCSDLNQSCRGRADFAAVA